MRRCLCAMSARSVLDISMTVCPSCRGGENGLGASERGVVRAEVDACRWKTGRVADVDGEGDPGTLPLLMYPRDMRLRFTLRALRGSEGDGDGDIGDAVHSGVVLPSVLLEPNTSRGVSGLAFALEMLAWRLRLMDDEREREPESEGDQARGPEAKGGTLAGVGVGGSFCGTAGAMSGERSFCGVGGASGCACECLGACSCSSRVSARPKSSSLRVGEPTSSPAEGRGTLVLTGERTGRECGSSVTAAGGAVDPACAETRLLNGTLTLLR